jgi:distribution and morphology protein 34
MSFKLNWNAIEKESFSIYTRELLEEALNSGKRPSILSDDIKIIDLNFGTTAPNFQILEIGDLGIDKFRGIFNFKYYGDASITLTTKISASLLKNYNNNLGDEFNFIKPNFIVSDCDFDIPLNLTLKNFKMSSIIIIVFSKTKGLTLVFKNDPLENIDVNSTFDKITPIANFLQNKIESQICDLFKEFLPSLLYKFSLKYTTQSFDQFHKDLLIEEQEEDDNRKKNKILLKDLDPENPFRISPGSLMRLTRLSSMRSTLSLGNGIDKLSCDRFNKDLITKAFVNILINKSNNYISNRIELNENDFEFGDIHDKLNFIKNFQHKAFARNSNHKPKRRTIKMNIKSSSKSTIEESKIEQPIPSINSNPMERLINNNSVFSDLQSDLETTSTSISSRSKRPSINKNNFTMSRSVSMNTSIPNINTLDDAIINSRKPLNSRRPSSIIVSNNNNKDDIKSSSLRNKKNLLQTKDATKMDIAEEREIRRRIMKLDNLVNKKADNMNKNNKNDIYLRHSQPLPPPPPPYSL